MGMGFCWVGYGYGSWYPWVTQAIHYYCSKNIATDPTKYGKVNYKYSTGSSITNLHYHIENHHSDEYVKICTQNNWPMMLTKRRLAEEQGDQTSSLLSVNPS
jgi:hypothetical protein